MSTNDNSTDNDEQSTTDEQYDKSITIEVPLDEVHRAAATAIKAEGVDVEKQLGAMGEVRPEVEKNLYNLYQGIKYNDDGGDTGN